MQSEQPELLKIVYSRGIGIKLGWGLPKPVALLIR